MKISEVRQQASGPLKSAELLSKMQMEAAVLKLQALTALTLPGQRADSFPGDCQDLPTYRLPFHRPQLASPSVPCS